MATKKELQLSLESAERNGMDIANEISQIALQSAVYPDQEWIIYKLVDTSRRGRVWIDGIDNDIMNPKTGIRERIWLLAGASSIWSTDLVEQLKDKDWLRTSRRSLEFEGGILRIPTWDERQIEFVNSCRHFIDNPSRRSGSRHEFFEYNPKKQQEAALAKELLEMDMAIEASKIDILQVRKLASFFGVVFYDELGQPKDDAGIRRELMLFAKREPKRFQQNLKSKEVDIAYLVKKAIIENKIDLGGTAGNVTWANGGMIGKMPQNRKAQEFLTELAMTNNSDGTAFLEHLQRV